MIDMKDCTDLDTAIKYLEENFGNDWYTRIDLDILNMNSSDKCIIGQLSGNIQTWCIEKYNYRYQYQYTLFSHCFGEEPLDDVWTEKIKQLRSGNQSVTTVNTEGDRYLLTFDNGKSMLVESLKDAPKGVPFTYKEI